MREQSVCMIVRGFLPEAEKSNTPNRAQCILPGEQTLAGEVCSAKGARWLAVWDLPHGMLGGLGHSAETREEEGVRPGTAGKDFWRRWNRASLIKREESLACIEKE